MLKVSGDGVFATLQGEGITAGQPSVFLRLHYCNLTCGKSEGWKCDTWYTWDKERKEYWTEPSDMGFREVAESMESAWKGAFDANEAKRAVITGGEPLLQQNKIIKLIEELPEWDIEIETNGTIVPAPELSNCQFNCSPKLENSGNKKAQRYNPLALKAISALPNSWFKFVVSDIGDLDEIGELVRDCELNEDKLLIMPEGQTADVVEGHAQLIRDAVNQRGWKITMRNQLIWYGDKRRT
jgi:organic radical activating enzyme